MKSAAIVLFLGSAISLSLIGCSSNPSYATSPSAISSTVTPAPGTGIITGTPDSDSGSDLPDSESDVIFQEGNALPKGRLAAKPSAELVSDSRLGAGLYSSNIWNDIPNLDSILNDLTDLSIKRLDTSMQEIEEPIDWDRSEYEIAVEYDRFIDDLNENGIVVNYMLHFWDKQGHASGETLSTPRFKTDEQTQGFLDYVRFVVSQFKGRVQYYTIWSEPDNCGGSQIKCIEPDDYINLARQTIPVILEEDPQAKVALAPNVLFFDREYLFTILRSDVIHMFDVIQWHGIYDVAPESEFYGDYYYEYPLIIEEIKQTAAAHGFDGEFWGTELTWCSEEYPTCHPPDQPWEIQKTDKLAAKYYARGIVVQLGMDVGVGYGGLESVDALWTYPTIRNLHTVLAGARPISFPVEIEHESPDTAIYIFKLPDGSTVFALWHNSVAVEDDPGESKTVIFPGLSAQTVLGVDVLHGFEQKLITETRNGNLVVPNLRIKDYPIILRFID